MSTKGLRRAGSKHSRARALRSRGRVRPPPTGIHKLGAMNERIGTDIYIPLKGERGRVVFTTKALFKRMFLDDDEIGTRDLETLAKSLKQFSKPIASHKGGSRKGAGFDERYRDIAQTVRIQKLLRNREVTVEYDRTAEALEMTGPDELVQEVNAWFTKNWDDLVHLMEVEDKES